MDRPDVSNNKQLFFVATLGIVYGDIGTSPLYAMKNCFSLYNLPVDRVNVLGILSLIFWSLVIVVSFKYIRLILKADNHGEGGILSLYTRVSHLGSAKLQGLILMLGIIGAALFYGDGVITPAISVLGALEGFNVIAHSYSHYIPYMAAIILTLLFIFQKNGSQTIGTLFGPIMILWFSALAIMGIYQISMNPEVLYALNPYYCFAFVVHNGTLSILTFGAIVLVVTGVEALYADLGHFNLRSIRNTWAYFVFPALSLNYFGQGALLLTSPESVSNPFYLMAPIWALYPLLILATLATIIASQAVISGIFSISWQAMQLEFFPRMKVIHTSAQQIGQVYLPVVNYLLLAGSLIAVAVFQNTENLTSAYGIAITGIMLITSILAFMLAHFAWKWSYTKIALIFAPFLILDVLFFSTNMIKFFKGGWFPVLIAVMIYFIIVSWKHGREALIHTRNLEKDDLSTYIKHSLEKYSTRIPGTAIFMCRSSDKVPATLEIHLKHNKFLHEKVIFLSIVTTTTPKVPKENRIEIDELGDNVYHVKAYSGFVEVPDLAFILNLMKKDGISINRPEATFFLSRGLPVPSEALFLTGVEENLFIFLSHNAASATDYYQIPYDQVVEYGVRFEV
uniref:Potassium transporter n=1 Tax=uncultured microorganism TaxID=358574 RepID=F8UGY4_9ZZZZ|nr:potassium transporter [uncultured microorganism]